MYFILYIIFIKLFHNLYHIKYMILLHNCISWDLQYEVSTHSSSHAEYPLLWPSCLSALRDGELILASSHQLESMVCIKLHTMFYPLPWVWKKSIIMYSHYSILQNSLTPEILACSISHPFFLPWSDRNYWSCPVSTSSLCCCCWVAVLQKVAFSADFFPVETCIEDSFLPSDGLLAHSQVLLK